jgi:hypothetical protein
MNAPALIESLARGPRMIRSIVEGVTETEARWKPPSGAWSIVEIISHLADEETLDFRARLELTLRDPGLDWPPIDPEGWARSRGYQQRDLETMLALLERERSVSVTWLRELGAADWAQARTHPRAGRIHAGDLLAAWTAHDLLHARQLVKRRYEWVSRIAEPFSTAYAGPWGP